MNALKGEIQCVYRDCRSNTKYIGESWMKGVQFIQFPDPKKQGVTCERWAQACGRPSFSHLDVTENTYLCTKHFVRGSGPGKRLPIPYSNSGDHSYPSVDCKSTSRYSCNVPQCKVRPDGKLAFHRFPREPALREKWLKAFCMKDVLKLPLACERHFSKDSYFTENPLLKRKRRSLKKNAVPTENLPDPNLIVKQERRVIMKRKSIPDPNSIVKTEPVTKKSKTLKSEDNENGGGSEDDRTLDSESDNSHHSDDEVLGSKKKKSLDLKKRKSPNTSKLKPRKKSISEEELKELTASAAKNELFVKIEDIGIVAKKLNCISNNIASPENKKLNHTSDNIARFENKKINRRSVNIASSENKKLNHTPDNIASSENKKLSSKSDNIESSEKPITKMDKKNPPLAKKQSRSVIKETRLQNNVRRFSERSGSISVPGNEKRQLSKAKKVLKNRPQNVKLSEKAGTNNQRVAWSLEEMQRAVSAILNGMPCRRASINFNIPRRSLERHVRKARETNNIATEVPQKGNQSTKKKQLSDKNVREVEEDASSPKNLRNSTSTLSTPKNADKGCENVKYKSSGCHENVTNSLKNSHKKLMKHKEENKVFLNPVVLNGSVASSDISVKAEEPERAPIDFLEPYLPVLYNNARIHLPDYIDCAAKPSQEGCVLCFKKLATREVCTCCPDCPEIPPLCLQPCFRAFHGY